MGSHGCSVAVDAAGFRERIAKHFYADRNDKWYEYPAKFRCLRESLPVHGRIRHINYDGSDPVFRSLASRAVKILDPLFLCVVEPSAAELSKKDGFLSRFPLHGYYGGGASVEQHSLGADGLFECRKRRTIVHKARQNQERSPLFDLKPCYACMKVQYCEVRRQLDTLCRIGSTAVYCMYDSGLLM